jgi:hypothetical protein
LRYAPKIYAVWEVEEGKMLFKLRTGKGSVSSFMGPDGVRHFPGDVVELPTSYKTEKWLEPAEKKEAKPVAAASKVEPAEPKADIPEKVADPAAVPLESHKKKRKSLSS